MDVRGSCCCGAVQFVIKGTPSAMGTCHCSRCRKLGTSTSVFVRRDQFTLERGEDDIETLEPRAPYTYVRSFCRRCGTSLGEPLSTEASFPINAQCLDDDPGVRNTFHEFASEAPAWATVPNEDEAHPAASATDHLIKMGAYVVCDDIGRSATFYQALFGREPAIRLDDFIAFDIAGGWFAMASRERYAPAAVRGSGAVPYIQSADLEQTRTRAEAALGKPAPDIIAEPGIRLLKLEDPDGQPIEFYALTAA